MIDWKHKLTSRKFWAAVVGFVSMLLVALGRDAEKAQQITALIMAGGSLIAYIFGEGLADSGGNGGEYTIKLPKDTEDMTHVWNEHDPMD